MSVARLCRAELIAGGFRNPPRVPDSDAGRAGPDSASYASVRSVRFRPLQRGAISPRPTSSRGETPKGPRHSAPAVPAEKRVSRRGLLPKMVGGAERAGRPRIARLQVGGCLVGRPPRAAPQALTATRPARTRERTVRFGRRAPFRGSSAAERPAVNRDVAGSNPALGAEGPCRSPARSPSSRDGESGAAPLTGMRSRRVDGTPSSKRPLAGSNPAERARASAPAVRLERTPRSERGHRRFESSRGYTTFTRAPGIW